MVQPPYQDEEQVPQDEGINQGRAHEEKEEEVPHEPPTQVWANIQRNHPVDQILGAISKVKGKCALGPFLCILVIECQHMCLIGNLCTWMNKVKIMK
jgi:hypothetical protein